MHAFNFSSNEQIEMSSQDYLIIDNQDCYSKLKYGDLIQVRVAGSQPSKEELAWLNAVRHRSGARKLVLESQSLESVKPKVVEDTKEAAIALAALAGLCNPDTTSVEPYPPSASVM